MSQPTNTFSLSYLGVRAQRPPNIITRPFNPTPTDAQNVVIGDFWINFNPQSPSLAKLWVLLGLSGGVANWVELVSYAGDVQTLTGDSGGTIFPLAGNITVSGGATGLTFAGTPNTLTVTGILNAAYGGTGTNGSAFTSDGTVYWNGSNLTTTGPGSAGQILTSNGAGSAPTYQNTNGSLTLIATKTLSSGTALTFTSLGSFRNYFLTFDSMNYTSTIPGGGDAFVVQISTNGGTSYIATGYTNAPIASTAGFSVSNVGTNTQYDSSYLYLFNATTGTNYIISNGTANIYDSATNSISATSKTGVYTVASTVMNALQVTTSSGTGIWSGVVSVYGIIT